MKRVVKRLIKNVLYRPRLGALGPGSYVKRPYRLSNHAQIFIGKDVEINPHVVLSPLLAYDGQQYNGSITICDDVYIGRFAQIFSINEVHLGFGSVVSDYVYISDNTHGFDPTKGLIMKQRLVSKGGVRIGKNCFLGMGVVVMPGITLGDWCVVGARSVVTKSFPPYSMVAGAPARLIRQYSYDESSWIDLLNSTEAIQRAGL